MDIKTRFDVGDKVWVIDRSRAVEKTVTQIRIIRGESTTIRYVFTSRADCQVEDKVYATKAELVANI